jgi:hypothetical protein
VGKFSRAPKAPWGGSRGPYLNGTAWKSFHFVFLLLADAPAARVTCGLMNGPINQLHHLSIRILMMMPRKTIDCRMVLPESNLDGEYLFAGKPLPPTEITIQLSPEVLKRGSRILGP